MKAFRPVLFLALVLLIIGLACNAVAGTEEVPPPPVVTEEPIEVNVDPTEAPATEAPTEVPPTEIVVATEPPQPMDYFTEEFDATDFNNWSSFLLYDETYSDPDKVTVETDGGRLVWSFDTEWVDYYLFYNAFEYEDVTVEVRAENRGKNNTAVGLVCRYDPEVGWYQFRIANNGLYVIEYYEILPSGKIRPNRIANGGSNDIKQGKATNEYSITCEGEELTLTINGAEVTTIPERKYGLNSGQIGVAVSSLNVLPIEVEMDWITISEP